MNRKPRKKERPALRLVSSHPALPAVGQPGETEREMKELIAELQREKRVAPTTEREPPPKAA